MQATLYRAKQIVQVGDDICNWLTQAVTEDEVIQVESTSLVTVNVQGVLVQKQNSVQTQLTKKQYVYPTNEHVVWNISLAHLQRQNPKDKIILLVQALTQDAKQQLKTIGYTLYEVMHNGTVKYGSATQELLMPPIILGLGSDLAKSSQEGQISFSVLHPDEQFSAGDFIPNNEP